MLLIGKETKEFKLKIHTRGFETNNCFTKLLVTPMRDSSISAAQRTRSATSRTTKIKQKLHKLSSMRQQLLEEKEKFDKFEKTSEFFDRIEKIVEERFRTENKAAVIIQSIFRGFLHRKIYIQKRIEIDREMTKKLLQDMENFVSNCYSSFMGHKAATIIQKHRRRMLAQRILKNSLQQIREKLNKENQSVLVIQKKFRHFLNYFNVQRAKDEKYKNLRLEHLRKKAMGRKILRFLKRFIELLSQEREDQRKQLTANNRRKGIRNVRRFRPCVHKDEGILARLSQALTNDPPDTEMIPNIYSIFRIIRSRNRPLTPSEHSQLQTEASSIRRRSVSIKRSLPRVDNSSHARDSKEEQKETKASYDFKNSKDLKEVKVFTSTEVKYSRGRNALEYLQNTENSYNRVHSRDQPPTPEFMKNSKKSRKINWTFLKPTISSEILKVSKVSGKSPILSTHFTRSPTPSMSSRMKLVSSQGITNPTLCPKFENQFLY